MADKKFAWASGALTEVDNNVTTVAYDENGILTDDSAKNIIQSGVVDNPNMAHALHALDELKRMGFQAYWNRNQSAANVKKIADNWDIVVNRNAREPVISLLVGLTKDITPDWAVCVIDVFLGKADGRWDAVSGFSYTDNIGTTQTVALSIFPIDSDNIRVYFRGTDAIASGHDWQIVIYRDVDGEREYRTFKVNLLKPDFTGIV